MKDCSCHISPPCDNCVNACPRCLKNPIDDRSEGWAEPACVSCYEAAVKEIPVGYYCYERLGPMTPEGKLPIRACPYWSSKSDKPEQENGHCALLGKGDWEIEGIGLLWDQVKECQEKQYDDTQDP